MARERKDEESQINSAYHVDVSVAVLVEATVELLVRVNWSRCDECDDETMCDYLPLKWCTVQY